MSKAKFKFSQFPREFGEVIIILFGLFGVLCLLGVLAVLGIKIVATFAIFLFD